MDAQPLWDDQRIDDVEPRYTETGKAYLMKLIRDDERKPLLARISQLEAELSAAREWVLVENGEYTMQGFSPGYTYTLRVDGADLEAWSNDHSNLYQDGSPRHVEEIGLGDYRLCKRRTEGGESV